MPGRNGQDPVRIDPVPARQEWREMGRTGASGPIVFNTDYTLPEEPDG
jgi:hypothetical protein